MIVVTGSLVGSEQSIDDLLAASLAHVRRSREEPGCLSHAVLRDVENPLRLVFLERWSDLDALRTHLAVTASGEFPGRAAELAVERSGLDVYDAAPASLR